MGIHSYFINSYMVQDHSNTYCGLSSTHHIFIAHSSHFCRWIGMPGGVCLFHSSTVFEALVTSLNNHYQTLYELWPTSPYPILGRCILKLRKVFYRDPLKRRYELRRTYCQQVRFEADILFHQILLEPARCDIH